MRECGLGEDRWVDDGPVANSHLKGWRLWLCESIGALVSVALLLVAAYYAQRLHGVLPWLLDRLTALLR